MNGQRPRTIPDGGGRLAQGRPRAPIPTRDIPRGGRSRCIEYSGRDHSAAVDGQVEYIRIEVSGMRNASANRVPILSVPDGNARRRAATRLLEGAADVNRVP